MALAATSDTFTFNGGDTKVSFVGKVSAARASAPVAELESPSVTPAKPHDKVIESLRVAGEKAEATGRGDVSKLLGKVADMIGGAPHTSQELMDSIAGAREANAKGKPDFNVTRALLAASRAAHDETGQSAGIAPVKSPELSGDEAVIARAAQLAAAKFGAPKSAMGDEPAVQFTPAQVKARETQIS